MLTTDRHPGDARAVLHRRRHPAGGTPPGSPSRNARSTWHTPGARSPPADAARADRTPGGRPAFPPWPCPKAANRIPRRKKAHGPSPGPGDRRGAASCPCGPAGHRACGPIRRAGFGFAALTSASSAHRPKAACRCCRCRGRDGAPTPRCARRDARPALPAARSAAEARRSPPPGGRSSARAFRALLRSNTHSYRNYGRGARQRPLSYPAEQFPVRSPRRAVRKVRIDDAVNLPERHARHAGGLVRRQRSVRHVRPLVFPSFREKYKGMERTMPRSAASIGSAGRVNGAYNPAMAKSAPLE